MIKKLSVLFVVLALVSISYAQDKVQRKAPIFMDAFSDAPVYNNVLISGDAPVTAANYIAVDNMANAYGPASNTLNPLAFDPISNTVALVHRGHSSYALGSGEMWWNWSSDLGDTWTRSTTSVQAGQTSSIVGRYPSMTLFNPSASTNMADLFGAFSWPELTPTDFGNMGYGVTEGMLESAYAEVIIGVIPNDYSTNVPTFADDQYIYWTSDFYNGGNGGNAALRLFRTTDYSTIETIDPPTWNSARFGDNGNIQMGGVAHNGAVYVGVFGSFTEDFSPNGWNIGYAKSTDNGATWADWNVVDFRTISSLGAYQAIWDWHIGDTFISYSGDIQVDNNGYVHFVTGLLDTNALTPAIFEIYETATNVWDAKMITVAHDNSNYLNYPNPTVPNDPGIGQMGPSIMIATNQARDFFAVQYDLGSPETADTLCDIYYHTRALSDANWSGSTNLTETNTMNEDGAHVAPYLATSDGTDYLFSGYWYETGVTTPTINPAAAATFYVAKVPVRTAGGDIPVTFSVDMGVQAFEGNFPAGANVVVRGSFQADFGDPGGNWQGNLYQLSDSDGDTIYTGTFNAPSSLAGNSYAFKYVIVNPPATDNWESTPDRPLTITAPATVLPTVWFINDSIPTVLTEVTNTLEFTADISSILGVGVGGAFDPNTDSLTVQGLDWDNLGKNVVGNRRMFNTDPFNTGIYTTELTFTSGSATPNGVGDSTKWKFRAFPDSRFGNTGWETGTDRWHIYVADGSTITLPIIIPRILPLLGPLNNDVPMQFTVDLTGAVNKYNGLPLPLNEIEFVGIKGAAPFLGAWGGNWTATDTVGGSTSTLKVMHSIGNNLWRYNVLVPAGTNSGEYEYKYAAMYPGADTVNGGSSPLDNEGAFGQNHKFLLVDKPIITLWDIFGNYILTDVKEINDLIPSVYELGQNYPNPFNPATTIKFSVPEAGLISLKVYNLLGQEVAILFDGDKPAGNYEATFDASVLASGIYFYTLEAKNFTSTRKMVLLK